MGESDPAGMTWRKSSASGTSDCVEVAFVGQRVLVRDSKHRGGPVLAFTLTEWHAFLRGARGGEFDASAVSGPRPIR